MTDNETNTEAVKPATTAATARKPAAKKAPAKPKTAFEMDKLKVSTTQWGDTMSTVHIEFPNKEKLKFEVDEDNWDSLMAMVEVQMYQVKHKLDERDEGDLTEQEQIDMLVLMNKYLLAFFGPAFFDESREYFRRQGRSLPNSYVQGVFQKLQDEKTDAPKGKR